ncbi:hypothetical protein L1S35_00330 [Flavobacterium sp. AS60]|uniref:hypothetical protein n=1 Tax=Flavobacterium anseongense TaxID=2910677 RepID=UPI001F1EDDFA|nr:hypothetical protein [Flavobacterium sp. AS60]MCF6128104.1 hypothetical protein [Flavobacterium sp. AS60]
MNTFKMALFGLLLTSVTAFSQYNDYYNYNRLGRNNRDIARDYSNTSSQPSAEQIEKAKTKKIDEIMANLKTELALDELQAIAIRNEIASSIKNIDIVSKKESSQEEKSKEIKALTDRTEATINSYLNPAQKEKYKALISESKSSKKDKKDKKNRGNSEASKEQSEAKDKTVEE